MGGEENQACRMRKGSGMTKIIGAKSCRSCEYMFRPEGAPKEMMMCRRYPPTVVAMPVPDPRANGAWGINGFYPQVNPDWPCGEYKRNDGKAIHELEAATAGLAAQ